MLSLELWAKLGEGKQLNQKLYFKDNMLSFWKCSNWNTCEA